MKVSVFAYCCAASSLLCWVAGCARRSPPPPAAAKPPEPSKSPQADVRAEIRHLATEPESVAKEFVEALRFDEPQVSYQLANPMYRKLSKVKQHEEQVAVFRSALGKVRQQQTWHQVLGISPDGVYANFTFRMYGEVQPADAYISLVHQAGRWSVLGFRVQFPTNKGFPKNTTERT